MPDMKGTEQYVDGVLMLLDRQITDVERLMVAKVDDVELTEEGDGTLTLTGLLCGPAALLPRLGGRFGNALQRYWVSLGRQQAERAKPHWVDLADVAELGSEVRLRVGRDGLLRPQPDNGDATRRHRLGQLLGMRVHDASGNAFGNVLDVAFDRNGIEHGDRAALSSILVGKGRPGARFGYDRRPEMGPVLLSHAIHRLQGKRGLVDAGDIRAIDWELGRVEVMAEPQPLADARMRT